MPRSENRVVLVAGGAGGMGVAIARRFVAHGDRVALADLAGPNLDAQTRALGDRAAAIPVDIRRPESCDAAVAAALDWAGRIDILVNAAGVWLEGPAAGVAEADWDRVLDVNLKGAFFLIRAALPHLPRGASIVNIASDAGLVGNSGAAVYCASKGGLVLLTKALALELAPRGIRVNAVCPGDVDTPMIDFQAARYGNGDPEGYRQALLAHYPQAASARFITADEVARMVDYLCEPDAAPVTGAALSIDFGVTAGY